MNAEPPSRPRTAPWSHYAWATVIVTVCVGTDWLMQGAMSESDLVMVFLMGVLVVARLFALGPALWAAALSVAAFDVLFVEPRYTFAVEDTRYLITFTVMGGAGIVLAGTTARIRRHAQSESDRAQRVSALYGLSRALVGCQDTRELCSMATEHMSAALGVHVRVLLDSDGIDPQLSAELELPLVGAKGRFGRVVLAALPAAGLEPAQLELLKAHAQQLTVALERAEAAAAQRTAELQVEQERMRSSLLSSVSHDLRTPLGVILGATTTLLEKNVTPSTVQRLELLHTIHGEATRLTRLLENLLQMTKIEGGALVVDKDWHVPEEVVGSAIRRLESSTAAQVEVRIDSEPSLVELDGLLIELVIINLLENASRHTPAGTRIQVVGQRDTDAYVFEIRDEGPGIAPDQLERVFEKFHRSPDGRGTGLGLAICRAIARAHGGDVVARARPSPIPPRVSASPTRGAKIR